MSARAPASPYAGEGGRTVRVLDAAGAREIAGPWRALAAAAMEPNIFYDPDFLLPAAEAFAAPGRLRFLVIGSGDRLLFLLPFRIVGTGPLTVAEAFRHPYATTTAPLLAAEDAGPALRLWLGGGAAALNACAWRLGEMPAGGPLHRALGQAAREVGAAIGIGRIGGAMTESMARQPEIAGNIQTAAIILAALIEGAALFALVIAFLI